MKALDAAVDVFRNCTRSHRGHQDGTGDVTLMTGRLFLRCWMRTDRIERTSLLTVMPTLQVIIPVGTS
jgi:hypothetical protein